MRWIVKGKIDRETLEEILGSFRWLINCWRIKDVSLYDPQAYGPHTFLTTDSQGSCQSAEQGDYKRSIYFYALATRTLTTIKLEKMTKLH
jgi:hypothetical protein